MKNKCWKPLLRLRKTSYQRGKVQTPKSLGKNEINSFIQFAALHIRIRIYFSVALCDFQLRGSGLGVAICLFNSSVSTRWLNSYNYRTFDFSNRVPYNSRSNDFGTFKFVSYVFYGCSGTFIKKWTCHVSKLTFFDAS